MSISYSVIYLLALCIDYESYVCGLKLSGAFLLLSVFPAGLVLPPVQNEPRNQSVRKQQTENKHAYIWF